MRPPNHRSRRSTVRRIATSVGAIVTGLVLTACSPRAGEAPGEHAEAVGPGKRLYVDLGCGRCHGLRLEGTRTAPPLTGLGAYWKHEDLVDFLKNPSAAMKQVPRLGYLSERYAIDMSAVRADDETLSRLATYLLAN